MFTYSERSERKRKVEKIGCVMSMKEVDQQQQQQQQQQQHTHKTMLAKQERRKSVESLLPRRGEM